MYCSTSPQTRNQIMETIENKPLKPLCFKKTWFVGTNTHVSDMNKNSYWRHNGHCWVVAFNFFMTQSLRQILCVGNLSSRNPDLLPSLSLKTKPETWKLNTMAKCRNNPEWQWLTSGKHANSGEIDGSTCVQLILWGWLRLEQLSGLFSPCFYMLLLCGSHIPGF